jgi:hypothetical protein
MIPHIAWPARVCAPAINIACCSRSQVISTRTFKRATLDSTEDHGRQRRASFPEHPALLFPAGGLDSGRRRFSLDG